MERLFSNREYVSKGGVEEKSSFQRGFIGVFLLLVPLLITCLMVFISLIFCIRNYNYVQSVCIRSTIKAQQVAGRKLKALLRLNPLAHSLRALYQKLKITYYAAVLMGDRVLAKAIRTKIQMVQKKREILDQKQRGILNLSLLGVKKIFLNFKGSLSKFRPRGVRMVYPLPHALAVEARPLGDIAPGYYVRSYFSKRQKVSIFWSMSLYRFLPEWLEKIFFNKRLSAYYCSSTLYGRGKTWLAGPTH